MAWTIRDERPGDEPAIAALTRAAFHDVAHSAGNEAAIVERLRQMDAGGCVVLGDPAYYRRFGFVHDAALAYPGPPPEYFQRMILSGPAPRGAVTYAPAFG